MDVPTMVPFRDTINKKIRTSPQNTHKGTRRVQGSARLSISITIENKYKYKHHELTPQQH